MVNRQQTTDNDKATLTTDNGLQTTDYRQRTTDNGLAIRSDDC